MEKHFLLPRWGCVYGWVFYPGLRFGLGCVVFPSLCGSFANALFCIIVSPPRLKAPQAPAASSESWHHE